MSTGVCEDRADLQSGLQHHKHQQALQSSISSRSLLNLHTTISGGGKRRGAGILRPLYLLFFKGDPVEDV
jgi:hypothetical protein